MSWITGVESINLVYHIAVGSPSSGSCAQESHTSWNIKVVSFISVLYHPLTIIHLVVPLDVGDHALHVHLGEGFN